MWRYWRLSLARRCSRDGSVCCCTLGPPGWSSRRSSAGTKNLPSPGVLAQTTKPTGARCLPGGLARVPGNPSSATNQARGDASADDLWKVTGSHRTQVARPCSSTVRTDNTSKVRFFATLREEQEVEVGLV